MANPVMSSLQKQFEKTPAGYPTMPGYQVGSGTHAESAGRSWQNQSIAQNQYSPTEDQVPSFSGPQPAAEPMTINDVVNRTGLCLMLLLGAAAIAWYFGTLNPQIMITMMMVGGIAALVLVVIASFKQQPSPVLTMGYALCEGLALGAISRFMEFQYPGIVIQALLGTAAVFIACLMLFKTGMVKVTNRFKQITLVAIIGIVIFSLINMGLMLFGVVETGLRQGPFGILIGVVAIVIGAMSLIWDFDIAREGVRYGAPKAMAWSCALGIMVTVVWIYIEILRILEIFRSR